jgi:DNA-directed RNA polymerase sigma subunit (sigma70/sigma32)
MKIIDSLKQQIAEEIGDDELSPKEDLIIRQKFGIVPAFTKPTNTTVTKKYNASKERKRGR